MKDRDLVELLLRRTEVYLIRLVDAIRRPDGAEYDRLHMARTDLLDAIEKVEQERPGVFG